MRRQYFYWIYLVVAIILAGYGGYLLFYNIKKGNGFSAAYLVLFIIGILMLVVYLILYLLSVAKAKKIEKERGSAPLIEKEEEIEAPKPVEKKVEPEEEPKPAPTVSAPHRQRDYEYVRGPARSFSGGDAYVKMVGYGPVLRLSDDRVYDMRNNTYYRIQGNLVYQEGSGLAFEISGNRIKEAFGPYLFEISGSSINKVFGGYYASISGGYITKYDSSEKYEITDSINRTQQLVVAALLFGR